MSWIKKHAAHTLEFARYFFVRWVSVWVHPLCGAPRADDNWRSDLVLGAILKGWALTLMLSSFTSFSRVPLWVKHLGQRGFTVWWNHTCHRVRVPPCSLTYMHRWWLNLCSGDVWGFEGSSRFARVDLPKLGSVSEHGSTVWAEFGQEQQGPPT